jgi:hypothetical protein
VFPGKSNYTNARPATHKEFQSFLNSFVGRPLKATLEACEGHYIAFVAEKPFPNRTEIMVTIGPGVMLLELRMLRLFVDKFCEWEFAVFGEGIFLFPDCGYF